MTAADVPARLETDVLIVGTGIAGLTCALQVARYAEVVVVTKKQRVESNTNYAQGGVAAVVSPEDSPRLHAADTMIAGAGLCHARAVADLVSEGPERVRELIEWGVRFSRDEGSFDLGREAGHSRRRILHAEDLTGREIERALLAAVAADPRIRVYDDHLVWSLHTTGEGRGARCTGALVLDVHGESWMTVAARAVVLASGGSSYLYRHTTNPDIATGDGVALGFAAGAAVANLEFVQFHPTALYPAEARAHLISEAVRGEGAVLRDQDGREFMDAYHPHGSLAPRDVVARAIDAELRRSGAPHVLLDASGIDPAAAADRFPHIRHVCLEHGIDFPREPIPVVPAAHYQCGGLLCDWDGRTSLPGLYAAGEVACTGVHGANRLASNSLLEAVVYSQRVARRIRSEEPAAAGGGAGGTNGADHPAEPRPPDLPAAGMAPEEMATRIRELMWTEVGIVRSDERLTKALATLETLQVEPVASGARGPDAMAGRQAEFMRTVALLIVRCARRRRESRGLHYTETYPWRDNERFLRDTVVSR